MDSVLGFGVNSGIWGQLWDWDWGHKRDKHKARAGTRPVPKRALGHRGHSAFELWGIYGVSYGILGSLMGFGVTDGVWDWGRGTMPVSYGVSCGIWSQFWDLRSVKG